MAEMTSMLKDDPKFHAQLAAMAKDPSFKNYATAVSSLLVEGTAYLRSNLTKFNQMERGDDARSGEQEEARESQR